MSANTQAIANNSELPKGTKEHIRKVSAIREDLIFDEVTGGMEIVKGKTVSVEELALVGENDAEFHKSAGIRMASVLLFSKDLPDVEGKTAYSIIAAKIKAKLGEKPFDNIQQLVWPIKVVKANGWTNVSPFTIKECKGYLNTLELADKETGKLAKGANSDTVIKKIKAGEAKSNAIRDTILKSKLSPANRDKFPKEVKAEAERIEKEKAKAANGGKAPEAKPKVEADSVDKVNREIESLCQRLGKLWEAGNVEEQRKGLTHAKPFAILCGVIK